MSHAQMKRREFLKGMGVAIALPHFPSLHTRASGAGEPPPVPARLLFMCVPLGFVPNKSLFNSDHFTSMGAKGWFPEQDGPLGELPSVHAALQPYREHISFLRGLCNRKYRADVHKADDTFLTCADTLADPSKATTNTISCDQLAAASPQLGGPEVRHPSLSLGVNTIICSTSGGLSWLANGSAVSPTHSPVEVFDRLFGKDDVPAETRLQRMRERRSILDATLGQIKQLDRRLNAADRAKLDEAVTAVGEVEARIQREERWLSVPKPEAPCSRPAARISSTSVEHVRTMLALVHAAFLTDSTRVITYQMPPSFTEVTHFDKHTLNHNPDPQTAVDYDKLDHAMSDEIAVLVKRLSESREHDGQSLLHHLSAVYGGALWGANHLLRHLPIMLLGHGGGKIKQGATRRYAEETPLANLWLTMLTAAGCEVQEGRFADSTGLLQDLL